ncbi:MAG: peptidoglycan-binding domain-containing protein [Thiolinea sp.]
MPKPKRAPPFHPPYVTVISLFLTCHLVAGCSTSTGIAQPDPEPTAAERPGSAARQALAQNRNRLQLPLSCQQAVLSPAQFRAETRPYLVFQGSPDFKNTPAEIVWETTRIQVEPARFPVETVPARYQEVTESIPVLRERSELVGIPAHYLTKPKKVTTREAYIRWKPGCTDPQTRQCFEQVPAETTVLEQKIIGTPARTVQRRIPEQTIEVKRKVLVSPGQGKGEPIPARYQDIRVGRVSKVWRLEAVNQPPRYQEVTIQRKVRPERIIEMPALCTEQATPEQIRPIQQRLRQQGYPASVQGDWDSTSQAALIDFQQDQGLAIGALTLETLRKLGLP